MCKFLSGIFEKVENSLLLLGIDSRHYACIRGGYIALKERAQPFSKIPLILAYGRQDATVLSKGSPFWRVKSSARSSVLWTVVEYCRRYCFFLTYANTKCMPRLFSAILAYFIRFHPPFSAPSSAVHLFLCIPKNAILFAYSKKLLYLCTRKLTLGCLRDISE